MSFQDGHTACVRCEIFLPPGRLYSTGLMLTSAKKSSSMPGRHILLCVTRSRWLASAFGRIHGGPELSDDVSQTDIAMARRHDLKGGVSVVRAEREVNDPEAHAVPASKVVARLEESKPPASSARQRRQIADRIPRECLQLGPSLAVAVFEMFGHRKYPSASRASLLAFCP
jgi:hypothetical protein